MALAVPEPGRSMDRMHDNFKFFAVLVMQSPEVIVKSDAAGEITGAVKQLGWHTEASLENRWPHNATLERWHGIYKSAVCAAVTECHPAGRVGLDPRIC